MGARLRSQLLLNELQKRVNLVFVVAAESEGWLRESGVANLLRCKSASRRILQRGLDAVEKSGDLVFVVAALSDSGLRESHVVNLRWSKAAATCQLGDAFLRV